MRWFFLCLCLSLRRSNSPRKLAAEPQEIQAILSALKLYLEDAYSSVQALSGQLELTAEVWSLLCYDVLR